MTRAIFILVLLSCIIILSAFKPLNYHSPYHIKTVVIDAGHGGKDPGCSYGGHKEKTIALSIAQKVGAYIKQNHPEVKVIYTRSNDKFIELWERASIANRNQADLFISIHVNAHNNVNVYGTETYAMGLHVSDKNMEARRDEQDVGSVVQRENEVILEEENYHENYDGFNPNDPSSHILFELFQSEYTEQSLSLASKIQDQFANRVKRKSRGVKQAGFVVLWKTTMPAVLVEVGYLTNSSERTYLVSDEGQVLLSSGIYRAFKEYKEEIEGK